MHKAIPILGICAACSNAGKTTLITRLITELQKRSIRVSVIKHAHHQFDIDHPGKDSYKIREAGAVQTLITSGKRWALMTEMPRTPSPPDEADFDAMVQLINPDYADLILVEGFKTAAIPKIEVHRSALDTPLLCLNDDSIIAVVSDAQLDLAQRTHLPILGINDITSIINFILQNIHIQ